MKIVNLFITGVITASFVFSCSNSENKNLPSVKFLEPSNITATPSVNFVDKNDLQSSSSENNNVITGNIYSNPENIYSLKPYVDYYDLKSYLNSIKDLVSLENVEITYNNKIIKSDLKGSFNLSKSEFDNNTKFKFSKQGYIPFETTIPNTAYSFYIALSPLYENELSAKEVKFRAKSGHYRGYIHDEFKQIPKLGLAYIIIDTSEKAKKLNLGEYSNLEPIVENIDYTKEMQIILTDNKEDNGVLSGTKSETFVDTVMETDSNLILSWHRSLYACLLPIIKQNGPIAYGDNFAIILQSIIVSKSDKEVVFNCNNEKIILEK